MQASVYILFYITFKMSPGSIRMCYCLIVHNMTQTGGIILAIMVWIWPCAVFKKKIFWHKTWAVQEAWTSIDHCYSQGLWMLDCMLETGFCFAQRPKRFFFLFGAPKNAAQHPNFDPGDP
jgi:hypothetical protein